MKHELPIQETNKQRNLVDLFECVPLSPTKWPEFRCQPHHLHFCLEPRSSWIPEAGLTFPIYRRNGESLQALAAHFEYLEQQEPPVRGT